MKNLQGLMEMDRAEIDGLLAGAYTRPLLSSNCAVHYTKYTLSTPLVPPDTP